MLSTRTPLLGSPDTYSNSCVGLLVGTSHGQGSKIYILRFAECWLPVAPGGSYDENTFLIGRVWCIREDSVLALSDGEPLMLWIRFSFVLHKERRIWCNNSCWALACAVLFVASCPVWFAWWKIIFDRKSLMHQWRLCISSIWWRLLHVEDILGFCLESRNIRSHAMSASGCCYTLRSLPVPNFQPQPAVLC